MIVLYSILGGASIVLVVLMSMRAYETHTRRVTIFTRGAHKLDPHLARVLVWGMGIVRTWSGVVRYLGRHFVMPHVRGVVRSVRSRLHHIFLETHRRLEGRRPLRNGGSVNFFLHSIGEYKQLQPERIRKEE